MTPSGSTSTHRQATSKQGGGRRSYCLRRTTTGGSASQSFAASTREAAASVALLPITKQRKGYPFEVELPDECSVEGVILADQVKSLDWRARRAELIARLPAAVTQDALAKLATLLA